LLQKELTTKQGLLLGWTLYLVACFATIMSLLSLYRRIFPTPGYKKIAFILMIVTILWFIGAMVGNFIMCIPFNSFWLRLKPGKCLNFNIYALGIGVVEVVSIF